MKWRIYYFFYNLYRNTVRAKDYSYATIRYHIRLGLRK